ncbi:DoxX family membrane protein [Flavobacterium silvaticum]|uniref:Efflux RND transporter permease subunit n=1 Tax=Flavobacterium silvaticum TaxID=1852020 RepID=A0A972JI21_9FLAO|nr:DoxX family membrane protein [Flavobacterium silvaticum]NMH27733.1 efflux RND transporter permease subunit [Flavobacterium silvaticum]
MNSKFTMIVRILLGLILVVFGSNKLVHFLPMQMPTGSAADFMNSLGATGYIFPVVGVLEVFIGLMLLLKKWVPFVIILLAPISINILLFHLFLDIPGVVAALLVVAFNGILIYKHWRLYRPLFH